MVHEVTVQNYIPSYVGEDFILGTYESHGSEYIHVVFDSDWDDCAVVAIFNNLFSTATVVNREGTFLVPANAIANPTFRGTYGTLTFVGVKKDYQVISADLKYKVLHHADIGGSIENPYSDVLESLLSDYYNKEQVDALIEALDIGDLPSIEAAVSALQEVAHSHSNLDVLNKLSYSGNKLLFDGKTISGIEAVTTAEELEEMAGREVGTIFLIPSTIFSTRDSIFNAGLYQIVDGGLNQITTFITSIEKAAIDEAVINQHTHTNKPALDKLTVTDGELYIDGKRFGVSQEVDPTVPSWAKQEKKPEYTYSEVGAEQSGAVSLHNDSASAHSELFVYKEDVSNKVDVIDAESTSYQYPTAKAVYDVVGDIETLLEGLR